MSIRTAALLLLLPLITLASEDLSSPLSKGDDAFFRMEYGDAIGFYSAALEEYPGSSEVLWRLARVLVCRGEVLEGRERVADCRQAEQYARKCIALDSTVSEGHSWRAAALGYIALDAGREEQVDLSHEVLREVEIALRLNPQNDAAWSIKGSLYRALGNVGWLERRLASLLMGDIPDGGFEEAEAALLQAIALAPDVMRHQYELGVLYIDWGRDDEARQALRIAATLPVRVAIDKPRLEKIHALLSDPTLW